MRFATFSQHAEACRIRGGAARLPAFTYAKENHNEFLFHMNGRQLFHQTAIHLPPFIEAFFDSAPCRLDEVDWVVPHQASRAAMDLMAKRLQIDPSRIIDILADHGNQISASIPTAFAHGIEAGKIRPGHRILLIGTGAGLGLGALLLHWRKS